MPGRVAAKVMQTALAVRDAWMTATDILAFIVVYFVTMLLIVGSFDLRMLLPFLGWLDAVRRVRCGTSCRASAGSRRRRPTRAR